MSRNRVLALLIVAGFALRLLLLFTTIGTTDVIFWTFWSNLVEKRGIAAAYAVTDQLNHPPLTLEILHLLKRAATATGVELTDLLRLMQVAADGISMLALLAIARRIGGEEDPWWKALYFFLTPVAIFVSGFHCNTDPTMIMLMLVALAFFVNGRDFAAGAALALAVSIKIPSLLLLPFLVVAARKGWWRIAAAFTGVMLATFTGTVMRGGTVVLKNVFGYRPIGSWGLPSLMDDLAVTTGAKSFFSPIAIWYTQHGNGVLLVVLGALGIAFLAAMRRQNGEESRLEVLRVIPLCYLAVLFLGAGFGIQYLLWPLPFVPFLFGRKSSMAWSLLTSAFMFAVYTYWCGGLPWWFAEATRRRPGELQMLWMIHVVWLTTGAFLIAGIWRWWTLAPRLDRERA